MILSLALIVLAGPPADTTPISIIPEPVSITRGTGEFVLTPGTMIWTDSATFNLGYQLAEYLEPATSIVLPVSTPGTLTAKIIILHIDASLTRLGAEGYRLVVEPERIVITAPEAAGLFYGIQSLRQLFPPDIFRSAVVGTPRWSAPAVTIEDYPRFPWRGAHLDVCRHFMPKEFIKKYIDLLALHKMNRFHWHLSDDQGWRIEIKRYPRLTDIGAWRRESMIGRFFSDPARQNFDGTRHGGFYTQDDIREIVAYAQDRFVTIVPEIEMPGHAQAAIAAYPWLGVTRDSVPVLTAWGVSEYILNPSDSSVTFMQDVLTEVMGLFPGAFIHVGGDEAIKNQWRASSQVQARIRRLHLQSEAEMQSWFIRQMDRFLNQRGRRLIGWDEILEGGLAENAAVMSWRGMTGGVAAARAGHDVVMAPTSNTYFDYYQSRDLLNEPLAIGGFLPLDSAYAFDPMPADLEPRFRKHILGAQGQLWSEYLKTPKEVEYMAYPRTSALAEVVWSPPERKNYQDFLARLGPHLERLQILDVNFRPLQSRIRCCMRTGSR
ncbi:MAG: beta-N-acetylhexosaminidase [Gemmatimonadota bacterium]